MSNALNENSIDKTKKTAKLETRYPIIADKNDVTTMDFVFKLLDCGILLASNSFGDEKTFVAVAFKDEKLNRRFNGKDVLFVAFNKDESCCRLLCDRKQVATSCKVFRKAKHIKKLVESIAVELMELAR